MLGLLAVLALLLRRWIGTEFSPYAGRLLLIGPFDDHALRQLLLLAALACGATWVIARCWVRLPTSAGGVAASTIVTVLAAVLPMIPALFALLSVALSLESRYVRVPEPAHPVDGELVLHIMNSWDEDESTQVYRRDGRFTYTATLASGYSQCVDEIDTDHLVVSVDRGATTISTDLTACRFTPLVVDPSERLLPVPPP